MKELVKVLNFEDGDSKRITLEFDNAIKRIDKISLTNIELTENGDKEIVSLKIENSRFNNASYSAGKHNFYFETGKTLFNDGAMFKISVIKSHTDKVENFSFVLDNKEWKMKEV